MRSVLLIRKEWRGQDSDRPGVGNSPKNSARRQPGGRFGKAKRPHGSRDAPMRLEIEVELPTDVFGIQTKAFRYVVAFEYPSGFRELRVFEESLSVDGTPVYTRGVSLEVPVVDIAKPGQDQAAKFAIDWHLVALPIIQEQSNRDVVRLQMVAGTHPDPQTNSRLDYRLRNWRSLPTPSPGAHPRIIGRPTAKPACQRVRETVPMPGGFQLPITPTWIANIVALTERIVHQ